MRAPLKTALASWAPSINIIIIIYYNRFFIRYLFVIFFNGKTNLFSLLVNSFQSD